LAAALVSVTTMLKSMEVSVVSVTWIFELTTKNVPGGTPALCG
jgi:hypothetical protein